MKRCIKVEELLLVEKPIIISMLYCVTAVMLICNYQKRSLRILKKKKTKISIINSA